MTSLMPGAGLLPIPTPTPLTTLGVSLGTLGAIPAAALDPNITALGEIPQPPIMGNVDPSKIDEIRRTVYVGNLNSQTTTADQLLEFFKQVGEVKFVRMAGDETQPTRFAFVEFADQNSVPRALAFNGVMFGDRPLKINHSNNAIVKPPEMTPQAAAKELEEVMKRVREAQSFISAAIEPGWLHSTNICSDFLGCFSRIFAKKEDVQSIGLLHHMCGTFHLCQITLEREVKEKAFDLVPILIQNPGLVQSPDLEGKDHIQNT
ncbi:PREDICTED: splicing regulatory glutamine/lysine-rich protein 1-like, partial [Acanthisitta chloris]|uniref:splicing regulatory glutamine/lysine-rich protein 1-like n=1 Tax=Acanthisitta chloris TaxID=57068 RepID=UPI0004F0DC81